MNEMKTWQHEAERVVRRLARSEQPFSSNDVWRAGIETPPNARWLGPVMQRLRAEGVIVKVASGILSERGHGSRMNSLWIGA